LAVFGRGRFKISRELQVADYAVGPTPVRTLWRADAEGVDSSIG
jgi:hypothetical protein